MLGRQGRVSLCKVVVSHDSFFLFFNHQNYHGWKDPGRSTVNWDSEPQEVDLL